VTSPIASTSSRGSRALGIATVIGLAVYLLFALVFSPADSGSDASVNAMGQLVRIMYVHVPVAITCFLAFAVTAFGGVMWLWKKSEAWDLLAAASAQIGVLFTALTLITGSIWGKIAWGTWWEWDARLTSTALLFVIGCGYLALRRVITDPIRRARYSAIVGVLAFLDVPIVHYSVDWWRGLHQPATITLRFSQADVMSTPLNEVQVGHISDAGVMTKTPDCIGQDLPAGANYCIVRPVARNAQALC